MRAAVFWGDNSHRLVDDAQDERSRLVKLGKSLGQAVEELITLVSPATFYRWGREEQGKTPKKNPTAGKRKSREVREFVVEIAQTTARLHADFG